MVENPISGPKLRPFSTHSFMKLVQYFHIKSLVDCYDFKMNNTLVLKMSINFMCGFDMQASLGYGDVGCFQHNLCCLLSGWKHCLSSHS